MPIVGRTQPGAALACRPCRQEEIDGHAHRGQHAPQHPDRAEPARSAAADHQREAGDRDGRARDGERSGPLAVTQPQPADDQQRAEVFQQQGDPDWHPLDGAPTTRQN
jgi:hypothetical protein